MTVGELITKLQTVNQDLEVYVFNDTGDNGRLDAVIGVGVDEAPIALGAERFEPFLGIEVEV